MFRRIIFFLLITAGTSGSAQSVKIFGQIVDSLQGPIPGSTVMLIGSQDSILKSFSVTDKAGTFSLTGIKAGDYILKASFFGYQPYEQKIFIGPGSLDTTVGRIQMQSKMLNSVMVEGHYVPIQIKGDTIEYDSRAFETDEHDVVEDLLRQLPGVEVAEDGTIKAQGKEVQKVLVDGEEFFSDDPTIATKNLPANAVDKVQVFDKQSDMEEFTGVDDGTDSPTINLKLKDTHKKGMFGNMELAGGTDAPILDGEKFADVFRYQAKGNVHYFKKKWQFSAIGMGNNINETGFSVRDYINFMGGVNNMMRDGGMGFDLDGGLPISEGGNNTGFLKTNSGGFNYNLKPSQQTVLNASLFFSNFDKTYDKALDRTTYFSDSSLFTTEAVNQNSKTFNNRGNIHFEQRFDSTHFLNVDLSGSWDLSNYYNGNDVRNYNPNYDLKSGFLTQLDQDNFAYNFTGAADYRKKFAKPGRYTGIGLSYNRDNSDAATSLDYIFDLYTNGSLSSFDISQVQNMIQTTSGMSGNWMWSEPLGKKQLLQFDYTHQNSSEKRNKNVFNVDSLGEQTPNDFFSADGEYFNFRHNGTIRHKFISNKLNTTTSVGYQYLNLSGDSIFTLGPKQFHYIMPVFNMEWEANKSSDLRLNYSTNVTAPTLNQLQPLPDNSNPSEVILGNSNLEPEYSHNLRLSFHNFNEFNFTHFMASITGTYVQNNITYSQNMNEFLVKEITPQNLGTETSANSYLAFGASLHPIHIKFNLSNSSNLSNGLINLNGTQDQYTSILTTPKITVENIDKKIINLRTGFSYTWSQNIYRDNAAFNNNFTNWSYFANFTLKLKERFEFRTDINHYFYPKFQTNSQQVILNAKIGFNLLESKTLQLFISGRDLLNQNTGISQYYFQNIYEQETTSTLARYFMLGLKYSFQRLGAAK